MVQDLLMEGQNILEKDDMEGAVARMAAAQTQEAPDTVPNALGLNRS
jgi:hypothetical protein